MKPLIAFTLLAIIGCSHPVRDERNVLRNAFRVHCIQADDYSPHRCAQLKKHILIDDLALAYGSAR